MASALENRGFQVLAVRRAEEAAALLDQTRRLNAMIIELEIAGRPTAWEIVRLARVRFANLPVVYASGRLDLLLAASSWENARFVRKPCVAEMIVREVASLLSEQAEDPAGPRRALAGSSLCGTNRVGGGGKPA